MKYCVNCGNKLENGMSFCSNCGVKVGEVKKEFEINIVSEPKKKVVAGLLGIFLGGIGVHNFYLGYTGKAVGQLLLTILSCGVLSFISCIWGLIEGIMILTDTITEDGKGNKLVD